MTFVYIGMGLALFFILLDNYLKKRNAPFRTYVMAVAIGIYLPLQLSTVIFLGGLFHRLLAKNGNSEGGCNRGILIASGLIAGESLMGILVAALIFFGLQIPISVWGGSGAPAWFSLIVAVIAFSLFGFAVRKR
ncbi:MAG: OPT/YSL family transporter [Deltaproteobacteria bacterium]|nr:OPT/YSL family transporter [Deltaproteobacteria bacterium]